MDGDVQGSHGQSGGFDGYGAPLAEAPIFDEHLLTFDVPLQRGSPNSAQHNALTTTTQTVGIGAGTGAGTAPALAKWWGEAKAMLSKMPVE